MERPTPDARPLVYVAGPITGNPWGCVRQGVDAFRVLREIGCTPFLPQLSVLHEMVAPMPHADWLAYDFEVIARCDALLRLPGDSPGADAEVDHARSLGIPVHIGHVPIAWVARWRDARAADRDQGNTNSQHLPVDAELVADHRDRGGCPWIITGDEGTSHCSLAERGSPDLDALTAAYERYRSDRSGDYETALHTFADAALAVAARLAASPATPDDERGHHWKRNNPWSHEIGPDACECGKGWPCPDAPARPAPSTPDDERLCSHCASDPSPSPRHRYIVARVAKTCPGRPAPS